MCNEEELNLIDVNQDAEVRRYGNTFVNSINLKETLKGAVDNEDDNEFNTKFEQFVETIQMRLAKSVNNFHPPELHENDDTNQNSARLDSGTRLKNKTSKNGFLEDYERGINIVTLNKEDQNSNKSINNRDDLEEQKEHHNEYTQNALSPQKSIFSYKDGDSVNIRETLSANQEHRMKGFSDG
eukprot:CAMPEP_0205808054 /NCGR_PEP_ID=MMETSP0205-20121125/11908_1 /ASSEMBLY_ACC=CAM_ASM_000278 /TAXON_ID=36767 /ORGANISM="Euplotes focardii, Strain TN1" /LENGTH=182 /DNA_ID=CAMNT_0053083149 /DNA_START=342 /DNA_END=886 /DNA_ORIENTATION=+